MVRGNNRYIAVSGNMGAGKSSLVEFLQRHFPVTPFFETNDENPYLKDFYVDMSRWAFHSQVFFLTQKFKLHQALSRAEGIVVMDRTIYEDAEIFASNLYRMGYITRRDFRTYWNLYQTLSDALRPPDLLIQLKCPLRTIMKRIRLRGRPEEKRIDPAYVRRLQRLYQSWFRRYDLSPVLVIDTSKIDFVQDLIGMLDTMQMLEHYLGSKGRF